MTCSIKSICATPTDARAIIKSWKKSDAGYSEMAASLGWCAHNCVGRIFLQIERSTVVAKWRVDAKSLRAAIQAILAKDPNPRTFCILSFSVLML